MNTFVHRVIHPRERALKRFADNEASSTERSSLAEHLAHCSSCRARVQSLRDLTASARALPTPQAGSQLLERIHQHLAKGEVVVLPARYVHSSRVSARAVGTVAAAITLTVGIWVLAPSPQLTAGTNVGELLFSPAQPRAGDRVSVEYRPASELSGEHTLVLRARYRTIFDESYNRSANHVVAATLQVDRRGVFRGAFDLPDSVVYAAFAVEDTARRRVDSNGRKLWELLVHDEEGRPTFDALTQRSNDLHGRDWELGLATVELQAELYPARPDAWSLLMSFQEVVRGETYADSVRPSHVQRVKAFHRRLASKPAPTVEDMHAMRRYAVNVGSEHLGGPEIVRYWADLLNADSSDHLLSVENRMWQLNSRALQDSLAAPAALAAYEELWRRHRLPNGTGAQVGRQIAMAARDTQAILRWTDRFAAEKWTWAVWLYSQLAERPSLRATALDRLRNQVPRFESPSDSIRTLELTREEFKRHVRKELRYALLAIGEVLLETGNVQGALDTLNLATREGWDLQLFRRAAAAKLTAGDTLGASRLFALLASDPGSSSATSDSLRRVLGPSVDRMAWGRMVDSARASLPARVAEYAVHKRIPRSIRVARPDGTVADLMAVLRGRATLVVFFSRTCGFAVNALPRIEEIRRELARHGVSLVMVINEPPSAEFRRYASEQRMTAETYHDSWSEALRAFNAAGSPLYFVLDSAGAIRFEYTSLERVLAEAMTVVPERAKVSD